MTRTEPISLMRGMWEIISRYLLNKPFMCFVMVPIVALAVAANCLYIAMSNLSAEMGYQIKAGDFNMHRDMAYRFLMYGMSAAVFEFIPVLVMSWVIQDIYRDSYRDVFLEYISLEYNTFHSMAPGDMESKINRKCKAVGEAIDVVIPTLLNSAIFIFVAMYDVYKSFGLFTALMFLFIPVSYIGITVYLTTRRNQIRGRYNKARDKSVRKLNDILYNYEIVKSYGLEEKEGQMLHAALNDRVDTGTSYSRSENIVSYLQKLSVLIPHVLILYVAINRSSLELESAMKLNGLHAILKERLTELAREFVELYEYYFDYSTSTFEADGDLGQAEIHGFERDIVVRDVGISRGEREILKDISFTLLNGEKMAVAGPNGAGKSTFINALLRFLDYSGDILIDGVEMKKYTKRSTRNLVAYVPQDNCILDDSVLRNLQYGNKEATFEEVKNICKRYKTDHIFSSLEGGYLKQAGQQGCELSGGQKQYLSLMRAIIKNSPIFILDEATSSVDYSTEIELINYIMSVLADRTIVMIVHNHALLKKFDKILFLKDKTMKGFGSIEELFKTSKEFTDFYLEEEEAAPDTGIQPGIEL